MGNGEYDNRDGQGVTIITTHHNADFDAMASLLAAQKLYPDALVVFPGSQERNLRNFFINSMAYLYNMIDMKDIDFSKISRLVLVDTRQPHRIGRLADLTNKKDIDIHIYDHHPSAPNDIKGTFEINRLTGATVTILTEFLADKQIDITPDEATIMCMGIYEDTGSFTFPSTTESDFKAAAYLLSKGANLNTVANLIAREITPEQVSLLNDMIQAATRYHISGFEIVITSVSTDHYVPDFAFLVHKLIKMEDLDAIFALGLMENKIYVVARSRIPEVDVGAIVTLLGGGGHPYAAAATVKEKTVAQVEHRLVDLLYAKIQSQRLAQNVMSAPPITVHPEVTCKQAKEMLNRYNINALLVTAEAPAPSSETDILGVITRQIIEKALFHKLGHVPISEYMTTEIATIDIEADIGEIQEKIIENKQRLLPVTDQGKLVGVITRTDLLNILVRRAKNANGKSLDPLNEPVHARTRNIAKFMTERLPDRLITILESIGKVAEGIGFSAYVVGGFVRDLFLYRTNEDIDIVIEGDGIAFARAFAKMVKARIHTHAKFGTAVIIYPDNFKIDVASARMEYYKFPAALPIVEMSSIKLDLFRRDFTINTLAVQLNPQRFGTLIDFFNAQKDVKEKVIRVLHNLSFVEDPTRVFRAIRFEQRFGFSIGKLTSGLIHNAVKMDFFKRLSGRRVFSELRQILEEDNPTPAMVRLHEYRLLNFIHPSIGLDKDMISLFNSVKKVLAWYDLLFLEESYMKWSVYFLALIRHCDQPTSMNICKQLELAPRYRKVFCNERFHAERSLTWLERHPTVKNSRLYEELSGFKTELILFMMAATKLEPIKKRISFFITKLRHVDVNVRGKDLKKFGLTPGPIYRRILQAVLAAKLNGKIQNRNEEIHFVEQYIERNAAMIPQPDIHTES